MTDPIITPAVISAGMAVVGTAVNANNAAHAGGGFDLNASGVNYPHEITDQHLVGSRHQMDVREVIKFRAIGGYWDDELSVTIGGFASMTDEPVVGYAADGDTAVPANRFLNAYFAKGGRSDTLTVGHLDCTITPYDRVLEPAESPTVVFRVTGRFDPTGPGDTNYEFEMMLNTWGQVSLRSAASQQAHISDEGDHILLWMDSREAVFGGGGTE